MTWLALAPFSREGVDDSFNASPQRVKIWLAIKAPKPGSGNGMGVSATCGTNGEVYVDCRFGLVQSGEERLAGGLNG